MKKQTTFYFDEELRRIVKKVCIDRDISVSSFINQAIKEKLIRESVENHEKAQGRSDL